MDRDVNPEIRLALEHVLSGDPVAMSFIARVPHPDLLFVAESLEEPLVLSRVAVIAVLSGLLKEQFTRVQVQEWASFVRRGYVGNQSKNPIRPIDISYEELYEDSISASVSRLDELGDIVDGEVSDGELLDLLQSFGEP